MLNLIKERFEKQKPFNDFRIGCLLHVTAETANLIKTFTFMEPAYRYARQILIRLKMKLLLPW